MGVDQSGGLVRLVFELAAGEHCESPRVAPLSLGSCPCVPRGVLNSGGSRAQIRTLP
jgi:hypothetical protein